MKGMTRRNFVKMAGIAMATAAAGSLWQDKTSLAETADAPAAPKAAEGGDHYVAPSQRQGGESVGYFTRDLSAAGLLKAYDAIAQNMTAKSASSCIRASRTARTSSRVRGSRRL